MFEAIQVAQYQENSRIYLPTYQLSTKYLNKVLYGSFWVNISFYL